jgi:hypothetical protein
MARARSIKPSFFDDRELLRHSPLARLLFAGLWTIADREGRLQDDSEWIKWKVLPADKCNVEKLLSGLARSGFIIRYQVDGAKYIQITNFRKHQNPHIKEAPSTIPAPCKPGASPVLERVRDGAGMGNSGTSPADSLNPVTDSLNPEPCNASTGPTPDAMQSENDPAPMRYEFDDSYKPFMEIYASTGAPVTEEDFRGAHFNWRVLDWEQKRACVNNIRERIDAGQWRPQDVIPWLRPTTYLRNREWKRPPVVPVDVVKPRQTAADEGRRLFEQMKRQREARRG